MTSPRDILTALAMLCFFLTIRSSAKLVMAPPICTFIHGLSRMLPMDKGSPVGTLAQFAV